MYAANSKRRFRDAKVLCGLGIVCLLSPCALAHTSLERYVRESVSISVSARNVDIRIQFSFPSTLSLLERQRMDRDGDGTISKKEQEDYLNDLQARAEQQVRLSMNGTAATLIPLEDPLLDLQDAPGSEPHPHELRLAYFARLPKDFGAGGTITLDSGLWTGLPLMISVATETGNGIRIRSRNSQGLMPPSKDGAMLRIADAQCTKWDPDNTRDGRK